MAFGEANMFEKLKSKFVTRLVGSTEGHSKCPFFRSKIPHLPHEIGSYTTPSMGRIAYFCSGLPGWMSWGDFVRIKIVSGARGSAYAESEGVYEVSILEKIATSPDDEVEKFCNELWNKFNIVCRHIWLKK